MTQEEKRALEVWAAENGRSPEEVLEELFPELFENYTDYEDPDVIGRFYF